MYAIVKAGGKQYKVNEGLIFSTEAIDAEVGASVQLEAIMVVDEDKVVTGEQAKSATVTAEVVEHGKGKKITIFTYKAKKNVRHKQGHRQPYTKLKVTKVTV